MKKKVPVKINERGAVMVETAMTFLVFMLFALLIFETGIAGFRALSVQYVASATARRAILGDMTVPTIKDFAILQGENFRIGLEEEDISVCGIDQMGNNGDCAFESIGQPENYLVVNVETETSFLLAGITITLRGTGVSRNERR